MYHHTFIILLESLILCFNYITVQDLYCYFRILEQLINILYTMTNVKVQNLFAS